jgi:hypothetical protein
MVSALALILVTSASNYMGIFVLASPTSTPPLDTSGNTGLAPPPAQGCTPNEVLDPNTGKCIPMSAAEAAKKFGACTEFECVLRTPLPPGGEAPPPGSAAEAAKKFGACTEFVCVLRTPLPPGGEVVPPTTTPSTPQQQYEACLRGVAGNVPGVCTPPTTDTTTSPSTTPGQNLAAEGGPAIGGDQIPPTGEQAPQGGEVPPEAPPEPADQVSDGEDQGGEGGEGGDEGGEGGDEGGEGGDEGGGEGN